jgi:TRAP transporter TAXI family solute receptor
MRETWRPLLFAIAFMIPAHADAQEVRLGTATLGGGFQLFGGALANAVNTLHGQVKIVETITKGSAENITLLREGKIDAALVEGTAAREAFAANEGPNKLAVLWIMYPSPGSFIVRADTPFQSISDLKGKRVAWGTAATGLRLLARDIVDGLGLDPEKDFQSIILDKAGDGPPLVLSGEADALWGGGIGWPGFDAVAKGPKGGRFIPPNAAEIAQILQKHPYLSEMAFPAGTYAGQTQAIPTVGLWSLILVRADLPEPLAYKLAETFASAEPALLDALPQTAFTTAANTAKYAAAADLHPGVLRYLHERGMLR